MAYIYHESNDGNIYFRYVDAAGTTQYTNLRWIVASIDQIKPNTFMHVNGYWSCNSDVNNIDDTGIGNTISGWTNLPSDSDGWGTLISIRMTGQRGVQLYYGWNTNAFYLRSFESSWESWKRMLFGSVSGTTLNITY